MPDDRGFPKRKTPLHLPPRWSGHSRPIVFLTVVTRLKRPLLARAEAHAAILEAWTIADDWLVGRYVVMPDHVHLLCSPGSVEAPLDRWIRFWKSQTTRRWPWPEEKPIWMPSHWDTQVRNEESLVEKWHYMWANPVRRGLVVEPEDWPYAGEIHRLEW